MLLYALLLLPPAYGLFIFFNGLRKNVAIAKQTGIPYVVLPTAYFNIFWQATCFLWMPLIRLLPSSWTDDILELLEPEPSWRLKFSQFEKRNTDMYLAVSPGLISLELASPEVVKQVTTRRVDFQKYVTAYKILEIYGPNVVSTEGQVWRAHRKITQTPFSERNNAVVWSEASYQASEMMKSWVGPNGEGGFRVETVEEDCMRLLLHIISRASFSVRLQWPGHETAEYNHDLNPMVDVVGASSASVPPGHRLSFRDALSTLLHNILPILILPAWFLRYSPIKSLRTSLLAYEEWGQYQRELFEKKIGDVRSDTAGATNDLLGALVKGAGYDEHIDPDKKSPSSGPRLSEEAIMGNAFVFMIAGHETTANTTQYTMVNLAFSYSAQDKLHADLDRLLPNGQACGDWDYETLFRSLSGSFLGAIVNEILRVWPPVTSIPKTTHTPQTVTWKGKSIVIPKDVLVSIHTPALHRYPGYWPTAPKGEEPRDNLNEFMPERWLWDIDYPNRKASAEEPVPDLKTDSTVIESSPGFFKPAPGSYVPFSEGPRACLGRRFAVVEMTAILAVIFQHHSVELDITDYLEEANGDEKLAWLKARDHVKWLTNEGSSSVITLQMRKGKVPIRFAKRGQELYRKYADL